MNYNVYTIYDRAAKHYLRPTCYQNDEVAIRAFKTLVLDATGQMGMFPEDYSLVLIGSYDDDIGWIESRDHQTVIRGDALVTPKESKE